MAERRANALSLDRMGELLRAVADGEEDAEKILGLIREGLRGEGVPEEQAGIFVRSLAQAAGVGAADRRDIESTTRPARRPFSMPFEEPPAPAQGPEAPGPQETPPARQKTLTRRERGGGFFRKQELFFGDSAQKVDEQIVRGEKLTVLIADDDRRIRMIYKIKLEERGYRVIEAADGNEAWNRISEGLVGAAIMDMKMPGMHGLDVMQRMVDAGMALPVVVCSAYDQLQDEFVVATYPRFKYLVKPVSADDLIAALEELIAKK